MLIDSYILITAKQRAYNALNSAGLLAYLDAVYCTAIPERTTQSKENIISGSYNATESGTPNFYAGYGYNGSGSGSIYLSLLNPTTGGLKYSQNDAHISILNRTGHKVTSGTIAKLNQGIELGQYDGSKGCWIATAYSDNNTYLNINGGAGVSFGSIADIRGWWYGERSGSTQIKLYKNSSLINTLNSTSVGIANQPFYALATNSSGSVLATSQSSKLISVITIGKKVPDGSIQTLNNIINQFLLDIGYPLKTAYGLGDSLMFGFNASVQDFSYFNRLCQNKHYDWVNAGLSGQKISAGSGQPSYNVSNTPTKTTFDNKLIVAWGLNDTYDIYYSGTILLSAVATGFQNFLNDAFAKGWSASDILLITDYQIQDNAYYTVTEYQTVTTEMKNTATSNGVSYLQITNAPAYTTSDGVHPANDAQYKIIADYIIEQRSLF